MAEESKEQPLPPQKQVEVEFVVPDPDDPLFTTYANNIQLAWTHFDTRLLFGEVVSSDPEKIIVEQRAQITISYMQAKLLMLMLAKAVQQYESIFGQINLPTGSAACKLEE